MGSDVVGLRPLTGAGLRLSDCSDLTIHQSECDKTEALRGTALTWKEGVTVSLAS